MASTSRPSTPSKHKAMLIRARSSSRPTTPIADPRPLCAQDLPPKQDAVIRLSAEQKKELNLCFNGPTRMDGVRVVRWRPSTSSPYTIVKSIVLNSPGTASSGLNPESRIHSPVSRHRVMVSPSTARKTPLVISHVQKPPSFQHLYSKSVEIERHSDCGAESFAHIDSESINGEGDNSHVVKDVFRDVAVERSFPQSPTQSVVLIHQDPIFDDAKVKKIQITVSIENASN